MPVGEVRYSELSPDRFNNLWDDRLGSIGGKLGGFRFRLRSLTVTKTAQALKLTHPTNRTNLMAVLPLLALQA